MSQPRFASSRHFRRAAVALLLAAVATWAGLTFVEARERAWAQETLELQAAHLLPHPAVPTIGEVFAARR